MPFSLVATDTRSGELGAVIASGPTHGVHVQLLQGVRGIVAVLGDCPSSFDFQLGSRREAEPENNPPDPFRLRLQGFGSGMSLRGCQLLGVNPAGETAAYSAPGCAPLFGYTEGTDHVTGGLFLSSANVIGAMSLSFERSQGSPLVTRLLFAIQSGARAGGDRDGCDRVQLVVFQAADQKAHYRIEIPPQEDPIRELERRLAEQPQR